MKLKLWVIRKILNFLFGPRLTEVVPAPHLGLIVVRVDGYMSMEAMQRIKRNFKDICPQHKVVVIEEGMSIQVI